jgi:hypothetical protein
MWGLSGVVGGRRGVGARTPRLARALVAATFVLAAAGPAPARAANPIGVHSMLYLNTPPAFMESMFAEAAGMHASAIRLDVAPALIFPSQGDPPDYSGLDQVMTLAQRYHLRVLADLLTIPPWMAACPDSDPVSRSRCPPASISDYGHMIGQIAAHAEPVIRDWEIWNEPDRAEFFSGTPADYAQMLRAAHDAIKAVDSQANVVLGGITGTYSTGWLDQVFATPGADAIHAFDTANLHERGGLDTLGGDVGTVRAFFAARGFTGPLWVTEHGYPADPAYQWDPAYHSGADAQSAYLSASVPSLVDAGASEVFVTERDNLGGADASEGLLGGDVADPPVSDPTPVQRPAYAAMARLAGCYEQLGRACPGAAAVANPEALAVPAVALGGAADATVTISDPGPAPLQLGAAVLTGAPPAGLSLSQDTCPALLEPDQTCTVSVHFTPLAAGGITGQVELPSDNGPLDVPVTAVAASVSALQSAQLPVPVFTASPTGDGVGSPQSLLLAVTNPLAAGISVGRAELTGPEGGRFHLVANRCRDALLAPAQTCAIALVITPTRVGTAHATLTLSGEGRPLIVPLAATARAAPAIRLLMADPARRRCSAPAATALVVLTSEPASLVWHAVRRAPAAPCRTSAGPSRAPRPGVGAAPGNSRSSVTGAAVTGSVMRVRSGRRGYLAALRLGRGLSPGSYQVTVTPRDRHGSGRARTVSVTVGAAPAGGRARR